MSLTQFGLEEMIMDAMKRIMVAVGFTDDYTEGLLKYAAQISQSLNAGLVIASIINSRDVEAVGTIAAMGYEVDSKQYVAGIKEERQQSLDEILKKISFPVEKTRTIIKTGHPTEELLKIAVNEKVELIIMGIKGRSDLESVLVGSVAEKVFRRSHVGVHANHTQNGPEDLLPVHLHLGADAVEQAHPDEETGLVSRRLPLRGKLLVLGGIHPHG